MENLLILLGIVGLFFFLMRRGGSGMGCCGGGHSHNNPSEQTEEKPGGHAQISHRKGQAPENKPTGCH